MAKFNKVCYETNSLYNFQVNLVSFADVRMCKCNVRVATVPDLFWQPVNEFRHFMQSAMAES